MFFETDLKTDRALVFNRFTGASIVVEKNWWDSLKQIYRGFPESDKYYHVLYPNLVNEKEYNQLESMGFFMTRELKAHFDRKLIEFYEVNRRSKYTNFFVSPSYKCPMGCAYCFQKTVKNCGDKLNLDDIKKIFNFIARYQKEKEIPSDKVVVVLFGGEPLLTENYEFNKAIIEHCKENGYLFKITTSGVVLTEAHKSLILEYKDILKEFDITLDGPMKYHDKTRPIKGDKSSYKHIKANIDKLVDLNLPVKVKVNLGKENINHFEKMVNEMIYYGWFKSRKFGLITNMVQSFGSVDDKDNKIGEDEITLKLIEVLRKDDFKEYLSKISIEGVKIVKYYASIFNLLGYQNLLNENVNMFDRYPKQSFCNPNSGTSFSFAPNGNVYTCNWMAGKDIFAVHNIHKHDQDFFEGLKKYQKCVIEEHPCSDCSISTLCGGGCLMDRRDKINYYQRCFKDNEVVLGNFAKNISDNYFECIKMEIRKYLVVSGGFKWEIK